LQHDLARFSPAASMIALLLALTVCLGIVLFSWPDPHDRKRAVVPKVADCCDVKIANTTLYSRRPRTPESPSREASVVPASLP
jgi:hypothetical protein